MEQNSFVRKAQNFDWASDQTVYVLAYHRVTDEVAMPLEGLDLVSATPQQFDAQMHLLSQEYNPVTAEKIIIAMDGGKPLPRNAVLITVDDGYRDFKEYIIPITQKYGIRPVLFVPTMFVGKGNFWWDLVPRALNNATVAAVDTPLGHIPLSSKEERYRAWNMISNHLRIEPFGTAMKWVDKFCREIAPNMNEIENETLNWEELREVSRLGADIASHTHSHPILSHIPLDQVRNELRISQDLINQNIGRVLPIFAFPDGRAFAMSKELIPVLRSEGFKLAFTKVGGRANLNKDEPLQLPRIDVYRGLSLAQFHIHLTQIYHFWKSLSKSNSYQA